MEVKIDKDANVGWSVQYAGMGYCCNDMIRAHNAYMPQILIGMRLGKPALIIPCRDTHDIIGQYCPFCGDKLTERRDDNEVQG